jgi:kinesin family member 11
MERRNTSMAPPPRGAGRSSIRPGVRTTAASSRAPARHASVASRLTRAASPAESLMSVATSTAGAKRKERDFDPDDGEATNINVVVRCRGRNEREVKENSAVVVRTDGTKGKLVGLSMGPNAVSDKTYNFDRVFSQAADQNMVFEEAVRPVLDEVSSAGPSPGRR